MPLSLGVELSPTALRAVALDRAVLHAWLRARATNAAAPLPLAAAVELPCDIANPDALTSALSQLRRMVGVSAPVILGLPTTSAILTTLQPLMPTPKCAAVAVQFELQQQLPFELADAAWHYRWSNGASRAASPSVIAAAVRRTLLEERLACCRRAGLSVGAVSLGALAALNAWRLFHPEASATLLHVLSPQAAEWILYTDGHLQVLSVAADTADAFSQELALSWESLQAEHPSATVHLMASDEMAGQISGILGGLGVAVERAVLPKPPPAPASGAEPPIQTLTALGLALQGFGIAALPLNLVAARQDDIRLQRIGRLTLWISSVCGVLAAGLLLSGMLQLRHERVMALQALEERQRNYQARRPEIRAVLQEQVKLEERLHQLEALVGESAALTRLLAHVAEALPNTVWLTKVEWSKSAPQSGTTRTAAPVRSSAMIEGVLEGRARSFQDATQLLERLKIIPGMIAVRSISAAPVVDAASGKETIAFAVQLQYGLQR